MHAEFRHVSAVPGFEFVHHYSAQRETFCLAAVSRTNYASTECCLRIINGELMLFAVYAISDKYAQQSLSRSIRQQEHSRYCAGVSDPYPGAPPVASVAYKQKDTVHRTSKAAISSMNFEDITNAVKSLRTGLATLVGAEV